MLASVAVPRLARSVFSQAGDRLDESDHLVLLDSARAVLVELGEALVEVTVGETGTVSHVGESVLHELLGLFLVERVRVVIIVLGPDLVHALSNHAVDFRGVVVVSHFCFSLNY